MLLAIIIKDKKAFKSGISFTSKKILQCAVVLLGLGLNLATIGKVGMSSLPIILSTIITSLIVAFILYKLLKIPNKTAILIGVGSSICGGSAIAATAPVIDADDEEIAQAISVIFLFNVIAAFLFPTIGHVFHMSNHTFGLWAGTAINDTSSVVAAGFTFSDAAGKLAVIVKLTRTLMIIPVTLALALYRSGKSRKEKKAAYRLTSIFPWFVLGFILASVITTFTPVPADFSEALTKAGKFMIVMAMACIGLNTNVVKLVKNGLKPILLGLICWISLAAVSLVVQYTILR
jgi:uncharacterized integral membrane protein (TIGR00698 family)